MRFALLSLLLSSAIKGSILCLCVLCVTAMSKKADPAIRHALWFAAILGFILVPLATVAIPQIAVPAPMLAGWIDPGVAPGEAAPHVSQGSPFSWKPWLAALWAAGALLCILRLVGANLILCRLTRKSMPLPGGWEEQARAASARVIPGRRIRFLTSDYCGVPVTYGTVRPIILLPPEPPEGSAELLRMIIMHELAHIKRQDILTGTIAYLICSLFWFVPFAWLALARLQVEREKACDLVVIRLTGKRVRYADMLLRLRMAGSSVVRAAILSAHIAWGKSFEERIRSALTVNAKNPETRKSVLLLVLVAGLLFASTLAVTQCSTGKGASLAGSGIPALWPIGPKSEARMGTVTNRFGPSIDPFTGKRYFHNAIDITSAPGTPIIATARGTVSEAGYDDVAGHFITIVHSGGYVTRYMKLQPNLEARIGDVVPAGQIIGYMGSSGYSTGPHLHYEVLKLNKPIDPLKAMDGALSTGEE